MPKRSLFTWMTSWMNREATAWHEPLKQTKRTLWCFAGWPLTQSRVVFDVSVENSWNKPNVWKGIRLFSLLENPGGNSDFMSSNLFWILVSGFRSRFSLNETGLGKYKRDYRTESKFISPEFCSPFAQTVKRPVYPYVKSRKSLCPKACDTASSHRYLPLGTFLQRAVWGGCIKDYA